MRWRSIVFLDHEEDHDNAGRLVTDRALRILHRKNVHDDSVVWRMPTWVSVEETLSYLLQWDYGEGELYDESPAGSRDEVIRVGRDGRVYEIAYNVGLSYIGLCEVTGE